MNFELLVTSTLLITEILILVIFIYHIIKLENTNKALLEHVTKLEEHVDILDKHIEKIDKHVDKLDEHSMVLDYHLKTILDYSRIHQMSEGERENFVKGLEDFLEK